MGQTVSDEQAELLAFALTHQRTEIVAALDALARKLRFREDAARDIARGVGKPDVLRVLRRAERTYLFVGIARSFAEPVQDARHRDGVRAWVRRFAQLVDHRRRSRLAGGYVMIGAYDDASADAWAGVLTELARPHRLQRDGEPARFVARRFGDLWVAC